MAAAKVDSEVIDPKMADQQQMFNMMEISRRGRMDEQRCTLTPSPSPARIRGQQNSQQGFCYQGPVRGLHYGSSPKISVTESTPEMNRRTVLLPSNHFQIPTQQNGPEDKEEMFMNLVSRGQRGRMDDQSCALDPSRSAPSTPTYSDRKPIGSAGNQDSEKLFNLLAQTRCQRLDDQRATIPSSPETKSERKGSSSDGSGYLCYMVSKLQGARMDDQRCSLPQIRPTENHLSAAGIPRSASFSPGFKSKDDVPPERALTPFEEKGFLKMMSHAQRGRMDEQRCVLNVSPKLTPKGIQNGGSSSASEKDASYLCYMVSKVQGSRMDEQRCSAPHILQNLNSPSTQRKEAPGKPKSVDLKHAKNNLQEPSPSEKESLYNVISQTQGRRMDDQRCSLGPSSSSTPATPTHNGSASNDSLTGEAADEFFRVISNSQAGRLDDQRVELPTLPGIKSGNSPRKQNASAQKVTLTESTSRRNRSASNCGIQMTGCGSPGGLPKSASFSPGTEYQNSPAQVTVRVSMSFTPQMAHKTLDQAGTFPEVFLTLGAPGDNLVIPLSPAGGRPLSFNLNLVPKEGFHSEQCSPGRASPRWARSRPSSPNPQAEKTLTINPQQEDSKLTEKVHASQEKGARYNLKGDHGKKKGRTDQGKGKEGGKKEKKNGGHKH